MTTLPGATRQRFAAVTCYLTSVLAQVAIAGTGRRWIGTAVAAPAGAGGRIPPTLAFPRDLASANALLFNFRDSLRKPSRTIYVVDISGSMCLEPGGKDGDPCAGSGARRIDGLAAALKGLAGARPAVPFAEQVAEFSRGEQVVLPFSDRVQPPITVNIDRDLAAGQQQVRQVADQLRPAGATFLYEALRSAYELAANLIQSEPDRITSIVLLTDGEANGDKKFGDFRTYFTGLRGTPAGNVRTFSIALGEANLGELTDVASLTAGLAYDTRHDSLTTVFFQIRGYV